MAKGPETHKPKFQETSESREVYTDDLAVIGPEDEVKTLEASPIGCGIMTISNKEHQVVGMIHHLKDGGWNWTIVS